MSNINRMISNDDQQLFTELTPAEGANVSGGYTYTIYNKSLIDVPFSFNGNNYEVDSGDEKSFYSRYQYAQVAYDSKIGPGYEPKYRSIKPGKSGFDQTAVDRLILTGNLVGGSNPPPAALSAPVQG